MQVNLNGVKSLQSEGTAVLSQKQAGSGNLSNFLQSNLKHQLIVCPRIVPHITAPEMTKPTLFSLGSCKATTGTVNSLKHQLQKEKYCKTDKVRISPDNRTEAMFGVLVFM